jgi:hypothetical protein
MERVEAEIKAKLAWEDAERKHLAEVRRLKQE